MSNGHPAGCASTAHGNHNTHLTRVCSLSDSLLFNDRQYLVLGSHVQGSRFTYIATLPGCPCGRLMITMLTVLILSTLILKPVLAKEPIDLWKIDNGPAPSREDGPPGAYYADRNPAHLKFELIAIFSALAGWLLGTALLIVLIKRRLRRKEKASIAPSDMISIKPRSRPEQIDAKKASSPGLMSPKSPGRLSSLKSWGKKGGHKNNASEYSISTVASFDEAHRAKNMEELSELYAAVMAHDERKEAQASVRSLAQSSTSAQYPSPPQQYPPEFQHLQNAPSSNRLHHPLAPTPVESNFPQQEDDDDLHEELVSRNSYKSTRSTPLSIISEISAKAGGLMSPKRPKHISIKNTRISQPMGSADLRDAHLYSESVPLSPRHYNPGPPPLTPGQRRQLQQSSQLRYGPADVEEEPETEQIQIHIQPLHEQEPVERERRVPPALALRSAAHQNFSMPAGAQTSVPSRAPKALPFRQVYGDSSMRSAPPTKTTFLERPGHVGPSASGPRTGVVPQTPYSPYMPFTPMTPITPKHLATREDLKKSRKEERLKVLSEDDLVTGEEDMWGKVR